MKGNIVSEFYTVVSIKTNNSNRLSVYKPRHSYAIDVLKQNFKLKNNQRNCN